MNYDFTIIGAGAAGLNLALAMIKEPFFTKKKVLIIESSNKKLNDRTWCYWEKGKGNFDHLVYKQWDETMFFSRIKTLRLDLGKYQYKMLRSADFNQYALHQIRMQDNFTFKAETVVGLNEFDQSVQINTSEESYISNHVFDSRQPGFPSDYSPFLLQHFKGWQIKFPNRILDDEHFTMMDFRNKVRDQTCFHYVLPTQRNEALVECTYFSKDVVSDKTYEQLMRAYIESQLGQKQFEVMYEESGIIPMTTYPFEKNNTQRITHIGTAGGWVKASTGYSFRFAQKYSATIVNNIVCHKPNLAPMIKHRFRWYDKIFLKILEQEPGSGNDLFRALYMKNPMSRILKFLDEETNIFEEFLILYSFLNLKFIGSLIKVFFGK